MTLRRAPQFQASPFPSEEEAAVIAAALVHLLDLEAAASPGPRPELGGLDPWVAEGRARATQRGVHEYHHALPPGRAWRLSGRAPAWGATTIHH